MIFKPRNILIFLSLTVIAACNIYKPTLIEVQNQQVEQKDTILEYLIAPYREALSEEMQTVIADLPADLNKGLPESELGNLICDLLAEESSKYFSDPIDFTIYNYGGIRVDKLYAGPLTKGRVFELLPFDNYAVVVSMDYYSVLQLCTKIATYGGWPVKGLNMKIKNDTPVSITINGLELDSTRTYHVLMNDYMANGGDGLDFIIGLNQVSSGKPVRDIILDAIESKTKSGEPITASIENRITIE